MPRILAFAGSTRTDSFNKKLMRAAASAARAEGAEVTELDLRDHPLPLYDGDLEAAEGIPAPALALKEIFGAHDGLLIASPEYNSSLSAVLKNTLDWLSRAKEGEAPLAAFRGKVAGLCAASPGALGGLRGLVPLRSILSNIGVLVVPTQVAVAKAHEAFDADGALADERTAARVAGMARELVDVVRRLEAGER